MDCGNCKHRIGDGHPYGNITCRVNGKYRYMDRDCDTGEYAPIVSDAEIIAQLQAEIEHLKRCGNCVHYVAGIVSNCTADVLDVCQTWHFKKACYQWKTVDTLAKGG